MPHLSILARTGGKPPGMEEDRALVPENREGPLIQIETARQRAREIREAYPGMYSQTEFD
jgi:hypothetical protein